MSTGKLVIKKFEDGSRFIKSLHVSIPIEDNFAETKFSQWMDGVQQKTIETGKSSRLVVKIVSGEEIKKIELDSCAKEVNEYNGDLNSVVNTFRMSVPLDLSSLINYNNKEKVQRALNFSNQQENQANALETSELNQLYDSNPLEHSLQKVMENNAKIMENIHMLNRTLNYTKKKEILDVICPKSMRTYPCTACGKCFVYETGLKRHYAMRHAMVGMQTRWQTVWTCIQCFQVWPQHDKAILHSKECCITIPDSVECVREIKTSLLLQCEFCEKVYTSIPRLLRHSKMHTTLNNYECNPCGLAFTSYKNVEAHWTICPWQKSHYCFTLPKMLLCNACDRKFRNYEQLYNHRYKVSHFMTKTCENPGQVKTSLMGVLVYQCELCDQWYTSLYELTSHRNQYHASITGMSIRTLDSFNKVIWGSGSQNENELI